MRRIALTALVLTACAPVVRVFSVDGQHTDTIKAAADPLGVRIRVVDEPGSGVVTLQFRDHEGRVCGEALEKTIPDTVRETLRDGIKCELTAWSCNEIRFVAHELGHLFGLGHVQADGNLMNPSPHPGATLTRAQKAQVFGLAHAFAYACWGQPSPVDAQTPPVVASAE